MPTTAVNLRIATPVAAELLDLRVVDPAANLIWRVPLSEPERARPVKLSLPSGTYQVVASAPHFATFKQKFAPRTKPVTLTVALLPLPRLTGTVIESLSGRPIPHAGVTTDTGCAAFAGDDGHFSIEPEPGKWPKTIAINAVGFGERTLIIPPARADATFDDIGMVDAASVAFEISGRHASDVIAVDLERLRYNGRASGPVVKTIDLPKNPSDAKGTHSFESVDAGKYALVARGREPWQRYSQLVTVSSHDQLVVPLPIDSFDLHIAAQNAPVDDERSRVALASREGFWEAKIPLVHNAADVSLWQGGAFVATLEFPGAPPFRDDKTITEGVSADWIINLPSSEVIGTVTDAQTAAPIPNAAIALRMRAGDGAVVTVATRAGQDGSFRFSPVMPGAQQVMAAAKGYPGNEVSYVFGESESTHNLSLTLTRTPSVALTMVDTRGLALANALVIDTRQGVGAIGRTDANGSISVFFGPEKSRQLFIVPLDGSLGFVTLSSDGPESSLPIPDGNARIVLRAETQTHAPLMGVALDMTYNGIRVPDQVLQALAGRGSRTATDVEGRIVLEHMPVGTYQFWPVASRADVNAIDRGRKPAVIMNVIPGENVASMTFEPTPKI